MSYASDLGLTVGSKIKIIAPKGTGSEYYDDQDILELTKDDRTPSPRFQNLTKGALAYFTVGDRTDECISWEHYKEPVKVTPKLVWKEMTLEEVKAVQVGDKIRIGGEETEIVYTYNKEYDFGFDINPMVSCHHSSTLGTERILGMQYKFEKLAEETEMNTRLERDKEYDVKLTGEEIGFCMALLAKTTGNLGYLPYTKFRKVLSTVLSIPNITITYSYDNDQIICEWLDKVFAAPETEDQRKLRELKEQYASLGKAIDAMEKK